MAEAASKPRGKAAGKAPTFTIERAQADLLQKLEKAGGKGVASLYTTATAAPKRELLEQALALLEERREVFVDRSGAKPKYYTWQCRPPELTAQSVSVQLLATARREHPRVYEAKPLGKRAGLSKREETFVTAALQHLCDEGELTALQFGATPKTLRTIYVAAEGSTRIEPAREAPSARHDPAAAVRQAYDALVRETGFPSIKIAALHEASGVPMEELKQWLLQEQAAGNIALSVADWSLASEEDRRGVIDLHGRRYLQVRWL